MKARIAPFPDRHSSHRKLLESLRDGQSRKVAAKDRREADRLRHSIIGTTRRWLESNERLQTSIADDGVFIRLVHVSELSPS